MLAERVKEWVHEWKAEEAEAKLDEGRTVLMEVLEKRFGPLPDEARQRVTSLNSLRRIIELSAAASTAPSLADLGLTES